MKSKKCLWWAAAFMLAFGLWTGLVMFVDVQSIGPESSRVGLATINRLVHNLTGVHMGLYTVTDWLGLVPIAFAIGFGLLGLVQWIGKGGLKNVDRSLFALGGFYILVMAAFFFFEKFVVNYRPVLIQGFLEASYPSSTTLLVMCVMPTAIMQLRERIGNCVIKGIVTAVLAGFIAFMVIGRLLSGVHWFSDIVGGALLSAGLVMLYRFVSR